MKTEARSAISRRFNRMRRDKRMAVPATIETRDQSRLSSFTVEHRGRKMYSCDEDPFISL